MSLKIGLTTSQKKPLAAMLKAIAEMIEKSVNERISIAVSLDFNPEEKDC